MNYAVPPYTDPKEELILNAKEIGKTFFKIKEQIEETTPIIQEFCDNLENIEVYYSVNGGKICKAGDITTLLEKVNRLEKTVKEFDNRLDDLERDNHKHDVSFGWVDDEFEELRERFEKVENRIKEIEATESKTIKNIEIITCGHCGKIIKDSNDIVKLQIYDDEGKVENRYFCKHCYNILLGMGMPRKLLEGEENER